MKKCKDCNIELTALNTILAHSKDRTKTYLRNVCKKCQSIRNSDHKGCSRRKVKTHCKDCNDELTEDNKSMRKHTTKSGEMTFTTLASCKKCINTLQRTYHGKRKEKEPLKKKVIKPKVVKVKVKKAPIIKEDKKEIEILIIKPKTVKDEMEMIFNKQIEDAKRAKQLSKDEEMINKYLEGKR